MFVDGDRVGNWLYYFSAHAHGYNLENSMLEY